MNAATELNHKDLCHLLHSFYYWETGNTPFLKGFVGDHTDLQQLEPASKTLYRIAYGAFCVRGDRYLLANDNPEAYPPTSYGMAAKALYHLAKALESRGNAELAQPHITQADVCLSGADGLYEADMDNSLLATHKKAEHNSFGAKDAQKKSASKKADNAKARKQRLYTAVQNRINKGGLWEVYTTATAMYDRLWYELGEAKKAGEPWEVEVETKTIVLCIGKPPTPHKELLLLLSVEDTKNITKTPLLKVIRKLSKENKELFL